MKTGGYKSYDGVTLLYQDRSLWCHQFDSARYSKHMTWLESSWWRHQMETFSALLAICAGNSPVPGEFPAQRPVTWSCDVFVDLRLNKRLSKKPWSWRFETLMRPLWRHCNVEHFTCDIFNDSFCTFTQIWLKFVLKDQIDNKSVCV